MAFAQMTWRSGSAERRGVRPRWRVGTALIAAGLAAGLLAALASASPAFATVVVSHSAKSGELRGGRLILRGVSGQASYVTDSGRSGATSVRQLHRLVFLSGKPAIGTLHIAGSRGGEDPSFRLTEPHYSAARRTVSYKAKPIPSTSASRDVAGAAALGAPLVFGAASPAPRQFAAASLSILPHPTLASGDNGGNDCSMIISVDDSLFADVGLSSSSQWSTDTWFAAPPQVISERDEAIITSEGGLWRGCSFSTIYSVYESSVTNVTVAVTWPWDGTITTSCTVATPNPYGVYCYRDDSTYIGWAIAQTAQPSG